MGLTHVEGRQAGKVTLYALSTCIWCRRTRNLLDELGIAYDYEYVDLLQGNERKQAMEAVRKWNPEVSFPTMIVGDKCIAGFKEAEIRETFRE
jgi:glutaredoxin-like protein NrdH